MSRPQEDVVYISPRGKRCVLVPLGGGKPWLYFRYLDEPSLSGDGFPLTHGNFRHMKEAARQGEAEHAAAAG